MESTRCGAAKWSAASRNFTPSAAGFYAGFGVIRVASSGTEVSSRPKPDVTADPIKVHAPVSISIAAMDAQSVARFFNDHSKPMLRAINDAVRRGGHLGLRGVHP